MATRIPNIFHFVFGLRPQNEPFHLLYYLCLQSCLEVNKPDKILFHYQNEPWGPWWDRIKPHLEMVKVTPNEWMASYEYKDNELEKFRYAHLADFTRLDALYAHGGVYADIDTIFVSPLKPAFFDESFVMGRELHNTDLKIEGSLCNALMAGEPAAPYLKIWMEATVAGFDGSWSAHSTTLPFTLAQQNPDLIHVEPQRSFFHLPYTLEGLTNLFLENDADMAGVYSMHLWNHLWMSHLWWNRDKLRPRFLHGDLITPAYVRHAPTTYARLARPFLPDDVKTTEEQYRAEMRKFQAASLARFLKEKVTKGRGK